jgi:hypothetical protein
MCTLGSVSGKYLFKTRDLGVDDSRTEEIIRAKRRYAYVGVAGRTNPQERGLNSGINEKGIAAAITFVGGDVNLSDAICQAIPRGVIVEDIVGSAATVLEALEIAQWHLNRNVYVGGNIVISGDEGIVSIEELQRRCAVEFDGSEFFFRTNHFLNLNQIEGEGDSSARLAAVRKAFEGKAPASVNLADVKDALSYRGQDAVIYKKPEDRLSFVTVSTVIYDIPARTAHYRYTIDPASAFQELRL